MDGCDARSGIIINKNYLRIAIFEQDEIDQASSMKMYFS
jgi:hypothetical protein